MARKENKQRGEELAKRDPKNRVSRFPLHIQKKIAKLQKKILDIWSDDKYSDDESAALTDDLQREIRMLEDRREDQIDPVRPAGKVVKKFEQVRKGQEKFREKERKEREKEVEKVAGKGRKIKE